MLNFKLSSIFVHLHLFLPFFTNKKKKTYFLRSMNGYLTLPRRHVFLRSGQPISSPQKQTRAAVKSVVISGETKYPVGREMPSLPTYRSMFWIQSFFTLTSSVFFLSLLPLPTFSFPLLFFRVTVSDRPFIRILFLLVKWCTIDSYNRHKRI